MARLEDLTTSARVTGVVTNQSVTVVQVQWHGTQAVTLTYRDDPGRVADQLLYRDSEPDLTVEQASAAWSFTADGALFRLVSEARRVELAYLFDPLLAVTTSNVMPLPHQITAVYEEMLQRQPLHFLLADDPGAGDSWRDPCTEANSTLPSEVSPQRSACRRPGERSPLWRWGSPRADFGPPSLTREGPSTNRRSGPLNGGRSLTPERALPLS